MKTKVLSKKEITEALEGLPDWKFKSDKLVRVYTFADFRAALAFMIKAGFDADAMNHHPEWTNVYDKVTVKLNTHSVGGKVTALDAKLALRMDQVAAQFAASAAA